jgi:hypothetical protein
MIIKKSTLAVAFCVWATASAAMTLVPEPSSSASAAAASEPDDPDLVDLGTPPAAGAGAAAEERKEPAAAEERKEPAAAGGPEADGSLGVNDAEVEAGRFDPRKAAGLRGLLRKLHGYKPGWVWEGLTSVLAGSPKEGESSMTFTVNRALNPETWTKAVTPGQPDPLVSLFIYSNKVDAWLKQELGLTPTAPSPGVILSPMVRVSRGASVHFPACPSVDSFILHEVLASRSLRFYIPVNAQALTVTDPGHFILAMVEVDPHPHDDPRIQLQVCDMKVTFYDSLMSGRSALFRSEEELEFTSALHTRLAGIVVGHGKIVYHRSRDQYLVVGSQVPGTTHCGRFLVLYTFAHMMGIPYADWGWKRFNSIMPDYLQVFGASR